MLIYLVGFMGSGKTTFGRQLAKALNYNFLDLDEYIEESQGKSINLLFSELGEDGFRKIEKEALTSTFGKNNTVVSTGGGTPCFFSNMEAINAHGTSVYLELPEDILVKRLEKKAMYRPLIKNKTKQELRDYVSTSMAKRESFYLKAKFKVDAEHTQPDVLSRIIQNF